jgi:hypothetical protein
VRRPVWEKGNWGYRLSNYWIVPTREHLRYRHLVFNLVHLGAIVLLVYWWHHLPPPGYAVGVLAVLAAAMSVHGEMRMGHKILWMLLIGAFLFAEFRAIDNDRAEFAMKEECRRRDENAQFQGIVDGLTDAVNLSRIQFAETRGKFESQEKRDQSISEQIRQIRENGFQAVLEKRQKLRKDIETLEIRMRVAWITLQQNTQLIAHGSREKNPEQLEQVHRQLQGERDAFDREFAEIKPKLIDLIAEVLIQTGDNLHPDKSTLAMSFGLYGADSASAVIENLKARMERLLF